MFSMAEDRIRWNDEEKALLSARVAELYASGITRPLDALREAQTLLPRNRRRVIRTLGQAPWLRQVVAKSQAAGLDGGAARCSAGSLVAGLGAGANSHRDALVEVFASFLRDVLDRVAVMPAADASAGTKTVKRRARKARSR
jgi:hypothetical protein